MLVSKKNQYAIRAVIEFVRHGTQIPAKAADIARLQGISVRFMEIILNDLKRGGILESRRGAEGGYLLAKKPKDITVLDVMQLIDGPIKIIRENGSNGKLDYFGKVATEALWNEIENGLAESFTSKTFDVLFEEEVKANGKDSYNYII